MPVDNSYLRNAYYPSTFFRLAEPPETKQQSIRLVLITKTGAKTLNAPKWAANVYTYDDGSGKTVREVAIHDWLLERAGLI